MIEKSHFYRLKAAMEDLVKKAGGIERAAELCGYSKSTVHRWASREHPELMPLPAIILLEDDTGDPIVTRAMCAVRGLNTVPSPATDGKIIGSFVRLNRAMAELNAEFAEAAADGVITGTEQERIDDAGSRVDEANEEVRGSVAAAGGRPIKLVG